MSFIPMHNASEALCVANAHVGWRAAPRRVNPCRFWGGKPPVVVFAHSRVRLYGALNALGKSLIEFSPPRTLPTPCPLCVSSDKCRDQWAFCPYPRSLKLGWQWGQSHNWVSRIVYFTIAESLFAKLISPSKKHIFATDNAFNGSSSIENAILSRETVFPEEPWIFSDNRDIFIFLPRNIYFL